MAQKITVALEDDLDGGPADEAVRFGLDGTEYEIDLSTKHAHCVPSAAGTLRRTCPQRWPRTAPPARAYRINSRTQRRYPGVGERSGHRGQRPRPHPGERR